MPETNQITFHMFLLCQSFVQRMIEGQTRIAYGFRISATPGLRYISWGIASSTLRLPFRLLMKPDLNTADLRIRLYSVYIMTLNFNAQWLLRARGSP